MFLKSHILRHPQEMVQLKIKGFLAVLANVRRVAVPTHNQA